MRKTFTTYIPMDHHGPMIHPCFWWGGGGFNGTVLLIYFQSIGHPTDVDPGDMTSGGLQELV